MQVGLNPTADPAATATGIAPLPLPLPTVRNPQNNHFPQWPTSIPSRRLFLGA